MAPDFALSSVWADGRFPSLAGFFETARELGFTRFELGFTVEPAGLEGLSLGGMITSVHEPCPARISAAELRRRNWLISAPDEEDRRQGVVATRRSIELAHKLGAQAVIVHAGQVDMDPALESTLIRLHREGKSDQPESARARERLLAERAAQAQANLRSVRRSLLELAEVAARLGVRLGLENRKHYYEIPLPDELDDLLDLDCGGVLGFWYDVGHAEVLQHLGLGTHVAWLRRFAGRMIGVHLHDVVGLKDHLAAGLGHVDWDMVARYVPAGALRTCEFQSFNSPQEVAAGLRWLVDREV